LVAEEQLEGVGGLGEDADRLRPADIDRACQVFCVRQLALVTGGG
jgi:hypothetical protein